MVRRADEVRVRQRLEWVFNGAGRSGSRGTAQAGAGPTAELKAGPSPEPAARLSQPEPAAGPDSEPTALLTQAGPAEVPPGAAFDPGRRGMRALAVVAVLVLAGAAYFAWQARPRPEPVAPPPIASFAPPDAPAESAGSVLVVAVTGRVRRPGLVRVPPGSRVADVIEAAGGALPDADLSQLNLARKVSDGELIPVGVPAPAGDAAQAGAPGGTGGKVNLNTATLAQLDALPGVGPVLAQRILDYRQRHGGFRAVSELGQVDGIGDAKFEQLKDLVTV